MAAPGDFAKLVPGFDFLQGLVKNAGAALPGMGQWVAPTLDPDELDKRIDQLKTVQFWLEQNARMINTTIQALEVQRMTLSTLRTMNLPVMDMADAFRLRPHEPRPDPAPAPAPQPAPQPAAQAEAQPAAAAEATAGVVDPMKWWTALTDQFTQLASNALKEIGPPGGGPAPGKPVTPATAAKPAPRPAAKPAAKSAPRKRTRKS